MKISELEVDAANGDEMFLVTSEGQTRKLPITALLHHLSQDSSFVRRVFKHPDFKYLLDSYVSKAFEAAGLQVNTNAEVTASNYIVPGQTLPNTESGIAIGGTVTVED